MLYSLFFFFFFFFFFLLLVPGCFSLKMRAKCKWRLWGKMEKKREKEETSLFYFPSPGFALFSHERERRDTRDADRKRERRKGREHQ